MPIFTRAIFGLHRELFPLEKWIESGEIEDAIEYDEDDFPIIDAHHHLWDP